MNFSFVAFEGGISVSYLMMIQGYKYQLFRIG